MDILEITEYIERLGDVLILAPHPGDGTPEIAWGDSFFYYAPDGVLPPGQPFATIVTKDYPEDRSARLDRPGAFRVNIAAGTPAYREQLGHAPREATATDTNDPMEDAVTAHPLYGELGWLAVVNPGPASRDVVLELLRTAHGLARDRRERRTADGRDHDG